MNAKESKRCRIPESKYYRITKKQLLEAIEKAFSDNYDDDTVAVASEILNGNEEVLSQNILFGKILEV